MNTFLGQTFRFTNPDLPASRIWRWNFNIQRELGRNYLLELGYMGSQGLDLTEGDRDLNFVPNQYLSTSLVRDQATIDRLSRNVPNPFAGLLPGLSLNSANVSTESLLRAYPQFSGSGGVSTNSLEIGGSTFHMLQARLEKRYSNGLSFLSNFLWSKMTEDIRRLNAGDAFAEHRVADEDRPFRFVASGTYELPFGKGKAFGAGTNGIVNRLIGGWQMNIIYIASSGSPINYESRNIIYYGGPMNLVSHPENAALGSAVFDTTRFETAANSQLDRNVRTFGSRFSNLRADGVGNMDFSLIKSTVIAERLSIQLRAEMFNALNRTQHNEPDTNPTSGTFGKLTSAANLPRAMQLGLRLRW